MGNMTRSKAVEFRQSCLWKKLEAFITIKRWERKASMDREK